LPTARSASDPSGPRRPSSPSAPPRHAAMPRPERPADSVRLAELRIETCAKRILARYGQALGYAKTCRQSWQVTKPAKQCQPTWDGFEASFGRQTRSVARAKQASGRRPSRCAKPPATSSWAARRKAIHWLQLVRVYPHIPHLHERLDPVRSCRGGPTRSSPTMIKFRIGGTARALRKAWTDLAGSNGKHRSTMALKTSRARLSPTSSCPSYADAR
jgi:hypothetical protein